jgi:hypothetical protein
MNMTIDQIYCEYRDELKAMISEYEKKSLLFEDREDIREFIEKAENLKTLVSFYAGLARENKS